MVSTETTIMPFRVLAERIAETLSSSETGENKEVLSARFNYVVSKYEGILKKICFSFSKSGSDYEDLRQDVLINIWKGLSLFREESEMSTWIYRVAFNTCVSTVRKNRINDSDKESLFSHFDLASDDNTEKRDNIEELHYLISLLGNEDKAIILMWLDEKKYEEIAEVTGIPRNTVATRIRRIKDKMVKMSKNN